MKNNAHYRQMVKRRKKNQKGWKPSMSGIYRCTRVISSHKRVRFFLGQSRGSRGVFARLWLQTDGVYECPLLVVALLVNVKLRVRWMLRVVCCESSTWNCSIVRRSSLFPLSYCSQASETLEKKCPPVDSSFRSVPSNRGLLHWILMYKWWLYQGTDW